MDSITNKDKQINLNQVVDILGVSSATIRNWIRHKYLKPLDKNNKKISFIYEDVLKLKEKIISGEISRLNKRANKKNSQTTFIPDEYVDNYEIINLIQEIILDFQKKGYERNKILYSIILNQLKNKGLISEKLEPKNNAVKKEVDWWNEKANDYYKELLSIKIPEVNDILGIIYQSLIEEGNKSENGSYYTPKKVVKEITDAYVKEDSLVLDPCCGTGQFLLSVAEKINNPDKIWGFDIDEIAVRLAKINILLHFSDKTFEPNIYHTNSLTFNQESINQKDEMPKFDLIITNPPWGVHFSGEQNAELQSIFPEIRSGESFSYFIRKSLSLLKENGILSFILPEAILNIKTHRDIREILIKKTEIKKIKYLNRVFKNVFTPVIRMDIINKEPGFESLITAEKNDLDYEIKQSRLLENNDYILNVFTNNNDINLFEKIYKIEHVTLKNNADWALGIVTGDNKRYLSNNKTETNEPIFTGKDIKKFTAITATNYIDFNKDKFQQVAPEYKYRVKEKLLYKFISKELVFAYDNQQTLSLNSANILIPQIKNYPIKTILALLNSSLYQFIYQKKFGAIKILRSDIEQLPIPLLTEQEHAEIEKMIQLLTTPNQNIEIKKTIFTELDNFIMDIFRLEESEKIYIKKSIKVSENLLNN